MIRTLKITCPKKKKRNVENNAFMGIIGIWSIINEGLNFIVPNLGLFNQIMKLTLTDCSSQNQNRTTVNNNLYMSYVTNLWLF